MLIVVPVRALSSTRYKFENFYEIIIKFNFTTR